MPQLMEVVLETRLDGQQCINRFNYLASGTPASVTMSFGLVSAMGAIDAAGVYPEGIFSSIRDMVSVDVAFIEIIAKDVHSVTDFYSRPFTNVFGLVSSASGNLPSFMAYSFTTSRVRSDIRRGQRRIAGLVEGSVDNFGALSAGNLALGAALATKMSANLTYDDEGNTLTFTPVIVGKEEYTTPSGKKAYRYYRPFSAQEPHLAQGMVWSVNPRATTQNSRKPGKGS